MSQGNIPRKSSEQRASLRMRTSVRHFGDHAIRPHSKFSPIGSALRSSANENYNRPHFWEVPDEPEFEDVYSSDF